MLRRTEHFLLVCLEGLQLVREVSKVEEFQCAIARGGQQPVGAHRVPAQVLAGSLVRVPVRAHTTTTLILIKIEVNVNVNA